MRDPKFDILFDTVRIGPCTTKNRFFAAPHGSGYGYRQPSANAALREIKAEGGWGVVCTEQVEIHPTSDLTPAIEHRLWDDNDIPALAAVAEAVHRHGALAAIQLSHSGVNTTGFDIREPPIGPSTVPVEPLMPPMPEPFHARGMDRQDIHNFRNWHRQAALRSMTAGFDIIYVYAGLLLSLPNQFLSANYNHRTDEYGGSLKNRMRLLRETVEDTLEVVRGQRAVAVRITLDELARNADDDYPELVAFFEMIGELPDLWDTPVGGMGTDVKSSRFDTTTTKTAILEKIKRLTSKPVVSVSVFETPEEMAEVVRSGVLDLVGAARPSIADPFLPMKVEVGETERIRPCIKCNICVASDLSGVSVQCTQNPTFGEEWRRGWHPEQLPAKTSDSHVLIVGAGPAGLECASVLARRGYQVTLCDENENVGGRISREARLPGLELWTKVRDFRLDQMAGLPNVEMKLGTLVTTRDIVQGDQSATVLATGSRWRRDGLDRQPAPGATIETGAPVWTPDDIMEGLEPTGRVAVYDDDHYYMGSVIAEHLADMGREVTLITPRAEAAAWTHMTMEQHFIQQRLLNIGVRIIPHRRLSSISSRGVTTACVFTGERQVVECDSTVLVTARIAEDAIYRELTDDPALAETRARQSIAIIGDAYVPGLIAAAIRGGHKFAREYGIPPASIAPIRRDMPIRVDDSARSPPPAERSEDRNQAQWQDAPTPPSLDPEEATHKEKQPAGFRLPIIEIDHIGNQQQAGEHEYLLSGFRHDLITALTRFRDWVVVEPGSKGNLAKVDYRVTAFSTDTNGRIDLHVTLLDAVNNRFIWSERYPISLDDWHHAQQDIVRRTAASMNVYLSAERLSGRTAAKSVSLKAYDKWLRGENLITKFDPRSTAEAEALFIEVIQEAPGFAPGYCSLASSMNIRHLAFPGTPRNDELTAEALSLAKRAVDIDPLEARAHLRLAWCYALSSKYDQADLHYDLAYDLNPNNPRTLISCAQGFAFTDRLDRASEMERAALELTQTIPEFLWAYLAAARFICGRYEESIEAANEAGNAILDMPGWKAVSYANLDRSEEAKQAGSELLALISRYWNGDNPCDDQQIVDWFLTSFPIRNPTTVSRLKDGLRYAGLPV